MLSRYLGISPESVDFDHSDSGKPMLVQNLRDPSSITFNLSHAHGRALIAVSNGQEVGVDLESVRSEIDAEALSKRYFAHSEHTAIMQALEEQRATRFFRYWVAKEALLKAQGIGSRGCPTARSSLRERGSTLTFEPAWVSTLPFRSGFACSVVKKDGRRPWPPKN